MAAPSARTKDPWRFVLVRDKQTLAVLATLHPGAAKAYKAAGLLLELSKERPQENTGKGQHGKA